MVPIVKSRHERMPEPLVPPAVPPAAAAADAGPHLRADARRNRAAILAAAEEAFSTLGPDAPVDEIARRARVGVGTFYRNFPTKEALLRAMVVAHIEPMVEAARAAAADDQPGEAVFTLLRNLARELSAFRPVADAVAASGMDVHAKGGATSDRLLAAVDAALTRAKQAGAMRLDVGVDEVAAMMGALCMSDIAAREPATFHRCVDVLCDGLRPVRAGTPGARP